MMEGVMNFGTAAGVRSLGFNAPAAGKTGTSHDGWFAGYTSNLLCIVWVGYDDYSDIRLSGAQTAAPIWAEFMKQAVALPRYSDVRSFTQPEGVVDVQLDKITNRLATPSCPDDYTIAFVAGTEPRETCEQSGTAQAGVPVAGGGNLPVPANGNAQAAAGVQSSPEEESKKKKGFFGKIVDVFKGNSGPQKDDKNAPVPSKSGDSGKPPQ
jgi:penicillin-binding protein 1B